MKRTTAIIAAIAAVSSVNIPYAVARLVDNAPQSDIIDFANQLDDRTTDHDHRGNELSDHAYQAHLEGSTALHYDGDKVVKTDQNMHDKETGTVMTDRQGNPIKVREAVKGSDDITFRGDNGTGLHNVSAGVEKTDAVNVGQLKDVENKADYATSETQKLWEDKASVQNVEELRGAHDEEVKERIKNDATTNDRIDTTNSNLDKESAARVTTDNNQQQQIDTKADAKEVNEWLETKADQSGLDSTNANVAGNTTAINNESGRAQEAERNNANAAAAAQNTANNGVEVGNAAYHQASVNSQSIVSLNNDINAVDSRSAQRAQAAERNANAYTDSAIGASEKRTNAKIEDVKGKAYSGVALSEAMSALAPTIHADKSAIGVAVGTYQSHGAVAVGYSHRFEDDATTIRLNTGVSDRNFGAALGVTHEF